MPWDSDKSTAQDPDNPQADEQLTADEWDNHVSEGHFPGDELNFGVDGNGDPVITDPQNSGQTVMRYDRSAGSWVVDALEAGKVSGATIYASAQDGDDRDVRLDNALSSASKGDNIVLENKSYFADRTISKSVKLTGSISVNGAAIANDTTWTIDTDSHSIVEGVQISGSLVVDQFNANIISCGGFGDQQTITAKQNSIKVIGCSEIEITFQSGTSDGIVDACSNVTVTDNGSNTVGDIA